MTAKVQEIAPAIEAGQGRRQGVVLAVLAMLFWSTTGPFIEILGKDYHLKPIELSFWRTLMISGLLAPIVWKRQGRAGFSLTRREFWLYALNGIIGIAVFNVAWSGSVQINGTAVASTLVYCAPIFVGLGGWLLLHESVGLARVIAIGVNILGCALAAGAYDPVALLQKPEGLLLGLTSGFTFAVYTLLGKITGRKNKRDDFSMLFYLFLFGCLALLPWGLVQEGTALFSPSLDLGGWGLLAALAFGPTLGGYILFTASLKYLPAAIASLFTSLELPVSALMALALFGRGLSLIQWLGAFLIVGAVVALQLNDFRNNRKSLKAASRNQG